MIIKECAIPAWVAHITGVVEPRHSSKPFDTQITDGISDEFGPFRALYFNSKVQELNNSQWRDCNKGLMAAAAKVVRIVDVIVTTIVQLDALLMKYSLDFVLAIIDESTDPTESEAVQVISYSENTLLIGD